MTNFADRLTKKANMIMKRLFLLSVILINSVVIFAQLKVDSNGHVGLGSSASSFASQLSINMTGHSDYAVSSAGADNGIYSEAQGNYAGSFRTSNDTGFRFGLFADAQSAEPSGFLSYSYGSKGAAGYGVYANAGLFGSVANCTRGCGVYGTTSISDIGCIAENSLFAGYFNGNTKVNGDLYVTGNVNGVLLSPSAPMARPLAGSDGSSVTKMLSGLRVSQYRPVASGLRFDDLPDSIIDKVVQAHGENVIERQYREKNHFGLSAENLGEVFPDLVYENEDGSKGINYMEMIPLLVQSINELNARIEELEGNGDVKAASRASSSTTSVGADPVPARK